MDDQLRLWEGADVKAVPCEDCGADVWSARRTVCPPCEMARRQPKPEPAPEPPEPEPEPEPQKWCECGWRLEARPSGRCPKCGDLLCDACGHSEGLHYGDWVRGNTGCPLRGCGCSCFVSAVLRTLGRS